MRVAVLGMGNVLLKDEGIGIHVIHYLKDVPNLGPVELVDGGTSPDAIELIRDADRIIIVDATRGGEEPGAIYRLRPEELQDLRPFSIHELNLLDMLWTMNILGDTPNITIIGIEPEEIDWGLELSPKLEQRLPRITAVVLEEIRKGLETESSREDVKTLAETQKVRE